MTGEHPSLTTDGLITGLTGVSPEVLTANQGAATTRDRATELARSAVNAAHDPEYIQNLEDFKNRSHQEIYQHAQQMQPGTMHASGEAWKLIGSGMQFATMALSSKVRTAAANGWEGTATAAMLAALDGYVSEMEAIQDVANGVGWRIVSAALAAEAVKAAVPAPPSSATSSSPTVPGLENPAILIGSEQAASDGHQEAVWAMANHYVPNYQPAGQGVPVFGAPTEPGNGANVPGTPGNSIPAGVSPQGVGEQPSTNAPEQTHQEDQPDNEDDVASPGDDSSAGDTNGGDSGDTSSSPAGDGDDSTTTAGTDTGTPAATATPGSPSSPSGPYGSGGSGVPGGSGTPIGPGTPGAQPGAGAPVAGRSMPGSPVGPGAVGVGPVAGAGARSTPGMGGMPGMGGAAGRRQGDQDGEHKGVPEWMINQRNTAELLGPREPTTPAVFGIDAGPIQDGEWEVVRRDDTEGQGGPAAFSADQPTQDDWSAASGERGEQAR